MARDKRLHALGLKLVERLPAMVLVELVQVPPHHWHRILFMAVEWGLNFLFSMSSRTTSSYWFQ
jgi:hypothetical protein